MYVHFCIYYIFYLQWEHCNTDVWKVHRWRCLSPEPELRSPNEGWDEGWDGVSDQLLLMVEVLKFQSLFSKKLYSFMFICHDQSIQALKRRTSRFLFSKAYTPWQRTKTACFHDFVVVLSRRMSTTVQLRKWKITRCVQYVCTSFVLYRILG